MPPAFSTTGSAGVAVDPGLARRGGGPLVLIAGAGIAGLATALALARKGIASHVLERRASFSEEGAGIQIGPNGTRILAALGVAEALQPLAGMPEALRVMDGIGGRELTRLPLGRWMSDRWQAPYWTLHRSDLHTALTRAARAASLIRLSMGAEISRVLQDRDGVEIAADSGATWQGDAIIAADGLWSELRSRIVPRTRGPRYAGRAALRAVIDTSAVPEAAMSSDTHIWLMPGAHVVHYPVRAGAEIAMIFIVEDREESRTWGLDVLPAWVAQRAHGLPEPLATLVARPKSWRKWSLHTLASAPRSFAAGRAALVGDAAHPILPFLAQGGVLALEDAIVLAQAMSERPGDVTAALAKYARLRQRRTERVARASERNGRIYHLSGLAAAARNMVLRHAPPPRLMQGYDWLYGWRA